MQLPKKKRRELEIFCSKFYTSCCLFRDKTRLQWWVGMELSVRGQRFSSPGPFFFFLCPPARCSGCRGTKKKNVFAPKRACSSTLKHASRETKRREGKKKEEKGPKGRGRCGMFANRKGCDQNGVDLFDCRKREKTGRVLLQKLKREARKQLAYKSM